MTYYPTDFTVAKALAADLKQHLHEHEALQAEGYPQAVVSGGIVGSLRKTLRDHGFDDKGDPVSSM